MYGREEAGLIDCAGFGFDAWPDTLEDAGKGALEDERVLSPCARYRIEAVDHCSCLDPLCVDGTG